MKIIDVVQGSPEWHAHRANHFNASDAPAMMGASKHTTRTELLRRMALGEVKEVDAATQRRFDAGHETEALARPLVEAMLGEELYPAVGVSDEHPRLAASFDGITIDHETGYEHKLWNEELAAKVRDGSIADDMAYWPQMEQQILVGGLKRVIFTVSDGTEERMETYTYVPRPGRAAQVIAGWAQFEADLAAYTPQTVKADVVGAAVDSLPTVSYKIDRTTLALTSNLEQFRMAAEAMIERAKTPLVSDQDFADRENMCKAFGEAEKKLEMLSEQVVGELQDIATFQRELGNIREMFRATRLANEKLVKAEKDNRKNAIVQAGQKALADHMRGINARFAGRVTVANPIADFAGAIKGKRTLASIEDAVSTTLARAKIDANTEADVIAHNLQTLDEQASELLHLFRDLQTIVTGKPEFFAALVRSRLDEHKSKEEARLKAETERIERETREKIEREARQKAEAEERARRDAEEAARITAEVQARKQAAQAAQAPAPALTPAPAAPVAPAATTAANEGISAESYAALRRPDGMACPSIGELVAGVADQWGVSEVTAIRWLQSINPAELAAALKTATEAQEA